MKSMQNDKIKTNQNIKCNKKQNKTKALGFQAFG